MAQSNAGDPAPEPSPVESTVESRADQPAMLRDRRRSAAAVVAKIRNYIQTNPIVARLKGDGFYPRIGGLSQGSGLAGGAAIDASSIGPLCDVSGACLDEGVSRS
jgi:hypothetical protein